MSNISIFKVYNNECSNAKDPVLSPDAVRLLRGLLELTPQALSDLSSVKKNQLVAYEKGERHLSIRDKRWLRSVFKAAGAEIFEAQGHMQVTLDGTPIIENGVASQAIETALLATEARESRYDLGLSQNQLARLSGVKQHLISMIETSRIGKYHLSDLLRLNCTLKAEQ